MNVVMVLQGTRRRADGTPTYTPPSLPPPEVTSGVSENGRREEVVCPSSYGAVDSLKPSMDPEVTESKGGTEAVHPSFNMSHPPPLPRR